MKKIISHVGLALCLASSLVCHAQNQYYYNEGDTIRGRDTTYFYQWWGDQWLSSDTAHKLAIVPGYYSQTFSSHGRVVSYNYTPLPLNIVGIATSYYNHVLSSSYANEHGLPCGWYNPCDIAPQFQEYVLLYEADTGRQGFYEVGRIPIDYSKPARYMEVDLRSSGLGFDGCCEVLQDWTKTIKIREFYFDKPITVRDSFYVGHTLNSNWWPNPEWENVEWPFGVTCWAVQFSKLSGCTTDQQNCAEAPLQLIKIKIDDYQLFSYDTSKWYYRHSPLHFIEFPIIEIDSSFYDGPPQYVCPPVENFRLAQTAPDRAVFLWDSHGDHNSWQISWGPAGTEPDDGTVIDCPMQVGQIMGLDSCTDYVAYIRAACIHDSIVYSQWSDPIGFSICDTTSGNGSDTTGITNPLAQYVSLLPNPAADNVQAISSFDIRSIEVVNLQGHTVLKQEAEGHSVGFSVAGWPAGAYFAIIHTSAGNFTKKLVVARK